jgi:hypothetical protein
MVGSEAQVVQHLGFAHFKGCTGVWGRKKVFVRVCRYADHGSRANLRLLVDRNEKVVLFLKVFLKLDVIDVMV